MFLFLVEEEEEEEEEVDTVSPIDNDLEASVTSHASLSSTSSDDLPFVIEGTMNNIGREGGGGGGGKKSKQDSFDDTDGPGGPGLLKRRVSNMKLIKPRMSRQASTSSAISSTSVGPDSYWRPKALFKAHKMKIQVLIIYYYYYYL